MLLLTQLLLTQDEVNKDGPHIDSSILLDGEPTERHELRGVICGLHRSAPV